MYVYCPYNLLNSTKYLLYLELKNSPVAVLTKTGKAKPYKKIFTWSICFFPKKTQNMSQSNGGGAGEWDKQTTHSDDETQLPYICGNCGFRNKLSPNGRIRCVACGYRILYKARTKRLVQFEAR